MRNTSTSSPSSESSPPLDVSSSLVMSSIPETQDVTEKNRPGMAKQKASGSSIVPDHDNTVNETFHEIMSMMTTKIIHKSALMFLQGVVNGYIARVLIDCGVSHNFISEDFVKSHDLKACHIPCVSVTVASGMKSYLDQALMNFELKVDNFSDVIACAYVFTTSHGTEYDVILDLALLFKNNPLIDWKTQIITIKTNDRNYFLKTKEFGGNPIDDNFGDTIECTDNILINAKQLSRCKNICLVTIKLTSDRVINSHSPNDKHISQLLNEFSDVLYDELVKLPPKRDIDHEIKIIEDVIPLSQQPFRMSQPELIQLKRQLEILLEKGFIRPSKSPYAAPVLFERRKMVLYVCVSIIVH